MNTLDKDNASFLPYIMEVLSQKPELGTSVRNLRQELIDTVIRAHVQPFDSVEDAVNFAINVGVRMQLINLVGGHLYMCVEFPTPRTVYRKRSKKSASNFRKRNKILPRQRVSKELKMSATKEFLVKRQNDALMACAKVRKTGGQKRFSNRKRRRQQHAQEFLQPIKNEEQPSTTGISQNETNLVKEEKSDSYNETISSPPTNVENLQESKKDI